MTAVLPADRPPLRALLDVLPPQARSRRRLAAGEALFLAGDPVERFFLVETGAVRLVRHGLAGAPVTLQVARPGEPVAEASLFADRYHCDAVAETASTVEAAARAAVLALLQAPGGAALVLLRHVAQELQRMRDRAEILSRHSARERLLAYLAARPRDRDGNCRIERPWKAVAAELGLTHEAVYRTLAALEREGVLARTGRGGVRLRPGHGEHGVHIAAT